MTGKEQAIAVQEPARLDEVLLAMDVVDTLRHQQDLVDHALAQDARDAALVARIREIYANQGIEVSDEIIAEGVEALKKDRFNYQPPAPSLRVRLARLYVRRGTWGKRLLAVGVVGLAGWLVYDIQGDLAERSRGKQARNVVEHAQRQLDSSATRLTTVQRDLAAIGASTTTADALRRLHGEASSDASRAAQAIEQARDHLASVGERAAAANDRAEAERLLAPVTAPLAEAGQALERATAGIGNLRQFDTLSQTLARAESRLAGMELAPAVAGDVDQLRQQSRQALAAGDVPLARGRIDRLEALATRLDQRYELRIVSRPGQQTGVWRHPADNPRARNYYIIVEVIGVDGQPLALPVVSEEDQSTRTVSTFGVRVSERVFEAIRADKADDGLIEQPLFAIKRRGALDPDYRYAVAGGTITSW